MKQFTRHILATAFVLFAVLFVGTDAYAYDITDTQGIKYQCVHRNSEDQAWIVGYAGTVQDLVIPEKVHCVDEYGVDRGYYTVRYIEEYAFSNASIVTMSIPSCVQTVKESAITDMPSLTSITVRDEENVVDQYHNLAFDTKSVVNCPNLTTAILLGRTNEIRENAFVDCPLLTHIQLGSNVTLLWSTSFDGSGLQPDEEGNLYLGAIFLHSDGTKPTVTVKEGTSWIARNAFRDNTTLEKLILPSTMRHIDYYACMNCTSLKEIVWGGREENIDYASFSGCSALESIVLPSTVRYLGGFITCANLKQITLNEGLETISGFEKCTSLTELVIPNSVTLLQNFAFDGCTALKSVVLGDGLTELGTGLFRGCYALEEVTFGKGITSIPNANGLLPFDASNTSLNTIHWNAVNCQDFTAETVPWRNNFSNYMYSKFDLSYQITTITFGDDVEHIPAYLCYNTTVKDLVVPDKVKTIGTYGLGSQTETTIVLGSSVESLEILPFGSQHGYLKYLRVKATTPPVATTILIDRWYSGWNTLPVLVPKGTLAAYKAADLWKDLFLLEYDEEMFTDPEKLIVNGTAMTEENCDDILGDGTVQFDPWRRVLTLSGAKLSGGISTKVDGLTIKLLKENVLGAPITSAVGGVLTITSDEPRTSSLRINASAAAISGFADVAIVEPFVYVSPEDAAYTGGALTANNVLIGYPTTYNIFIGGVEVLLKNATNVLGDGSIAYDSTTNTLTLNNVNIDSNSFEGGDEYSQYGLCFIGGQAVTINLVGDNSFTGFQNGLYTENTDITITSTSANGTLLLGDLESYEGMVVDGANVTITNCKVTAIGQQEHLLGMNNSTATTGGGGGTVVIIDDGGAEEDTGDTSLPIGGGDIAIGDGDDVVIGGGTKSTGILTVTHATLTMGSPTSYEWTTAMAGMEQLILNGTKIKVPQGAFFVAESADRSQYNYATGNLLVEGDSNSGGIGGEIVRVGDDIAIGDSGEVVPGGGEVVPGGDEEGEETGETGSFRSVSYAVIAPIDEKLPLNLSFDVNGEVVVVFGSPSYLKEQEHEDYRETFTGVPLVSASTDALNYTWTSSNETVATVNSKGEVTVVGLGVTSITASYAGDYDWQADEASYILAVTTPDLNTQSEGQEVEFNQWDYQEYNEQTGDYEQKDLSNTVIDEVYFAVDNVTDAENPDGAYVYDEDTYEGYIVLNKETTESEMDVVVDNEPGTPEVTDNFNGIIIKVAAGSGTVIVNTETLGSTYLAVQIGNEDPYIVQQSSRGDVEVPYSVNLDTYIYIYATSLPTSPAPRATLSAPRTSHHAPSTKSIVAANSVKIYSIKVVPTAFIITVSTAQYATYYNSKAMRLPAGVKAATIDGVEGSSLTVNYRYDGDDSSKNVIPAGTAVLLSATADNYTLTIVNDDTQSAPSENLLHGSDTETTTWGDWGSTFYKLTYSADGTQFGFFWGATDGGAFTSPAHKAWLAIPESLMSVSIAGFNLDGEATGISSPSPTLPKGRESGLYLIDGRKVSLSPLGETEGALPKGIYVKNGKKFIVK